MSRINLQTSDDIISFLRILAEESVMAAEKSMSDDDLQSSLQKRMRSDEEVYGSLEEQPDAEEVEADTEISIEEPAAAPEEESGNLEVSLDSISRAVNDLRSGRSVDDSKMKEELRAYFDRLEETEKEALYAFLKSFAGILTGQYPGSEAPDPSDPPYNISMDHGGGSSAEAGEEEEADTEIVSADEPAQQDTSDDEDQEPADSPPIRAGSTGQDLSEVRKRVRSLMNLK